MIIFGTKILDDFVAIRGNERFEQPLARWRSAVALAAWPTPNAMRAMFGSASIVGECVVFNISGNNGRLVTRIDYANQTVSVLAMMWHDEYDDGTWISECGCR